ncbi:sodium/solute symporter [Aeoliella sp. ICT_H6.2]|uniref:Sodium/solute symporter n=1 Tax=Aeoliella straminimaris TaxID=2954799 RepID=A0A9X2F629_9BACT|nr:sodium/solute symporter [Aeoliella straminimaris]
MLLLAAGVGAIAGASDTAPPDDLLHWQELPQLPDSLGIAGAYVGMVGDRLIVAGGSNFPDWEDPKQYLNTIYALDLAHRETADWRLVGRLPRPLAHGAAVGTPRGLFCMGGTDASGETAEAFWIEWHGDTNSAEVVTEPAALPSPRSYLAAAILGQKVYVAGGNHQGKQLEEFLCLDLDAPRNERGWQRLPTWEGPPRSGALLVPQWDGFADRLYLVSGKHGSEYLRDVHSFSPSEGTWRQQAEVPRAAFAAPVAAVGQSHLMVFSGSDGHDVDGIAELQPDYQFVRDVLVYHTITDTWSTMGKMPQGVAGTYAVSWHNSLFLPGGELRPRIRTPDGWQVTPQPAPPKFGMIDYVALVLYLASLAGIGFYCSRRENSSSDFFLGGKRLPWWAIGLSLMATQVSSIGFMAIPGKVFATNWVYFTGVATWFLVVPIVTRAYLPFFSRLKITSAYEYLEVRFNGAVRMLGATAFVLTQLGRMTIVLYLPAIALNAVTGIDVVWCIVLMGSLATAYTIAGGIEAVVWTDVLQAVMLLLGGLACITVVVLDLEGGLGELFAVASEHDKFRMVDPGWQFTTTALWVVLVGNLFQRLAMLTADQASVQRFLATKDQRSATRALWTDVAVSVPWAVLIYLLGTALYVFYRSNPALMDPGVRVDGIVPLFIAQQLPPGLSGFIIASIFAAAMSSLDSSMHSVATVLVTDFYARLRPERSDAARLHMARWITLALGCLATVSAILVKQFGILSSLDLFTTIVGLTIGIVAGLFVLGIFTARGNSSGAIMGVICSTVALYFVYGHVHFFLYSMIGVIVTTVAGYLFSLLLPGESTTAGLCLAVKQRSE